MSFLAFFRGNARWIVGAFVLTFFSTVGQTSFIGLSAGFIRSEYGLSNGQWGLVYMIGTLGSALTLPYLGQVVDRYPVRRIVVSVLPMLALAAVMMALSHRLALLVLTIYLLRLFGQGMTSHTAYTATARWFSAQRGRALSLVILGHNAGEAVLITSFAGLAATIGWRGGWLVAGALVVLLALPLVLRLVAVDRTPGPGEINPPGGRCA